MWELLDGAGVFAWPLGLLSFLALFVVLERTFALRQGAVLPRDLWEDVVDAGRLPQPDASTLGEIVRFVRDHRPSAEGLVAFAKLRVTQLERHLYVLDFTVGAAPLVGLLGTVVGLFKVFGKISAESGIPDTQLFVEGIALALSTTIMGLFIAIPSLAFSIALNRRVDHLSAELEVAIQALAAHLPTGSPAPAPVPAAPQV